MASSSKQIMYCIELPVRCIVSIYQNLPADLEQNSLNFQDDAIEEKVKYGLNQIGNAWDGEFVSFGET